MTGNTSNGNDSKKQGMVWHFILTYPVLLVISGVFAFFAVKSVCGIVNAEYAFLNGCDLKESIDSSVSLVHYMYGDDFSFALADISARVVSGILAVWGIITVVLLSDKKRKALPSLTGYMILLLIFNVGYAVYRYIDVGICDFFKPAGSYFALRFAVNFQFTVYAFASLALLLVNRAYYKKRKNLFD